jgi:hypothetical protein
MEDWYEVLVDDIKQIIPTLTFGNYNLNYLVGEMYPEISWNLAKLSPNRSSQGILGKALKQLFPGLGKLFDL